MLATFEEFGGDCAVCDVNDRTPLHVAVLQSRFEVAQVLMSTFFHQRDKEGFTALDYAALSGNVPLLELFVKNLDSSLPPAPQPRILQCAIMSGSTEAIRLVLADLRIPASTVDPRNGRTALHYAVQSSQTSLERLLEAVPKMRDLVGVGDKAGRRPLHLAARDNHTSNCSLLLKNHADPFTVDNKGLTAFHYAASVWNGAESLKELLQSASKSRLDEFSFLLSPGRTPKMSCLHIAAYVSNEDAFDLMFKQLLPEEFDPNTLDRYRVRQLTSGMS